MPHMFWGTRRRPLVQPCACRGSSKLVHSACLKTWRRTGPGEDAAYRCGQCKDEYRDPLSLELLRERLQAERMHGEATSNTLGILVSELYEQGHYDEVEPLRHEFELAARRNIQQSQDEAARMLLMASLFQKAPFSKKGDLASKVLLLTMLLEGYRQSGVDTPNATNLANELASSWQHPENLAARAIQLHWKKTSARLVSPRLVSPRS